MIICHQNGINTKFRQFRNFGIASDERYRKVLEPMDLKKNSIAYIFIYNCFNPKTVNALRLLRRELKENYGS